MHAELKEDYPNLPVDKAQVLLYEHSPQSPGNVRTQTRVLRPKSAGGARRRSAYGHRREQDRSGEH